jgi:glycosyltransferase involved in cell wall biosynthesis
VVIPCFRSAATIRRALHSIAEQTTQPNEVILVDDASGDETLTLLREIEQQYAGWIKVAALQENRGAASARNAGWALATQPYIAFLDADDSWHPEKLQRQYQFMRNHPEVALCGHRCIWLREGDMPPVIEEPVQAVKISAKSLLFKNAFSTPTVMLKRDIPLRFKDGKRFAEDLLLWQQIAFAGLPVMRIESPLAYVHKSMYGEDGLSAQLWKMEQQELDNFIDLYRQNRISRLLFIAVTGFSIIKYFKRLLNMAIKHRLGVTDRPRSLFRFWRAHGR